MTNREKGHLSICPVMDETSLEAASQAIIEWIPSSKLRISSSSEHGMVCYSGGPFYVYVVYLRHEWVWMYSYMYKSFFLLLLRTYIFSLFLLLSISQLHAIRRLPIIEGQGYHKAAAKILTRSLHFFPRKSIQVWKKKQQSNQIKTILVDDVLFVGVRISALVH